MFVSDQYLQTIFCLRLMLYPSSVAIGNTYEQDQHCDRNLFCSSGFQKQGGKTNERNKGNAYPLSGKWMLSNILCNGRTIGRVQSHQFGSYTICQKILIPESA
jgi:hypothetical protein